MINRHKKVCLNLSDTKLFLVSSSVVTGCMLTSGCASLLSYPLGITRSATALKFCAITAAITRFQELTRFEY